MTRARLGWLVVPLFLLAATLGGAYAQPETAPPPQIHVGVLVAEVTAEADVLAGLPGGAPEAPNVKGQRVLQPNEAEHVRAAVQAMRKLGHARVLAEPNLTTLSGQVASFQVGGDGPAPRPAGQVVVQNQPAGTRVDCLPALLPTGKLALQVLVERNEPEVRPGRVRTSAEMVSGQSLVLIGEPEGPPTKPYRRLVLLTPSAQPMQPAGSIVPAGGMPAQRGEAGLLPLKVGAADGRVQVRCPLFEATADHLEQDAHQFVLEGKVRLVRTGDAAATELTAERIVVRVEGGRLQIRAGE